MGHAKEKDSHTEPYYHEPQQSVTILLHFQDYVTPSKQFAFDVQLGVCWPLRVLLQALSYIFICEDVKAVKWNINRP